MNQLQHIQITELHHHPNNPRLELGDLTELSESIKARGVMQNLTVVPRYRDMTKDEYAAACKAYRENPTEEGQRIINQHQVFDGYNVVIGNRRMEAAKLAGLESLPCIVAEMTEKEQMSTMLLENMQRSDLSIYEQAQGFQMMMDLGMTTEEISAKTGFSDSTVRRRVKLTAFDKEGFKTACDNGATLLDFAELSKVDSEDERNRILADAKDANDLRSKISIAIRDQERLKVIAELEPKLAAFAKPMDQSKIYSSKFSRADSWDYDHALEHFKVPKDADKIKYYYYISNWSITLYKDVEKPELTDAEREAKEREKKRKFYAKESVEWGKAAASFRQMFVEKFTPTKTQLQHLQNVVIQLALQQTNSYNGGLVAYHHWDDDEFRYLLNMPREEERSNEESIWDECQRRNIPEGRALLAWMLCGGIYEDKLTQTYCSEYDGTYRANKELDKIYELLCSVGYCMSSNDLALQDGSHKCFKREEE